LALSVQDCLQLLDLLGRDVGLIDEMNQQLADVPTEHPVRDFTLSPDGQRLLVALEIPHVFGLDDRRSIARVTPSGDEYVVATRSDGASGRSTRVTVHDAYTGEVKRLIHEGFHQRPIDRLEISPDETTIVLKFGREFLVQDYATGETIGSIASPSPVSDAVYSPAGDLLAVSSMGGHEVILYDTATLVPRTSIQLPLPMPARTWRFTPDGDHLLVQQDLGDSYVLWSLWNIDARRAVWSRRAYARSVPVFSPNGDLFLTNSSLISGAPCLLWEVSSGRILVAFVFSGPSREREIVFSADGHALHFESTDGPQLWPTGFQ
jgi:WD40 repeat protein